MTSSTTCILKSDHTKSGFLRGLKSRLALGFLLVATFQTSSALAGIAASVTIKPGELTIIAPGESTVLQIILSNNNISSQVNNLNFSNLLPGSYPNRLHVSGPTTYTCFNPASGMSTPGVGALTAVPGSQLIVVAGGVIPPRDAPSSTDGSCTIQIPVSAGTSSGAATSYTYTILGGAVTGDDGGPVSNIGDVSQSINVSAMNQPSISKSFNNSTAILGGAARILTISVQNPASNALPLEDVGFVDNFPSQGAGGAIIEVATPVTTTSTCTGGGTPLVFNGLSAGNTSLSTSGGAVVPGGSCTVTVAVVATHTNGAYQTSSLANVIDADSQFTNGIGIRAQSNASANIRARSPLAVTKSFSPSSLAHGQTGSMTVRWTNQGQTPLTVASFTDDPISGVVVGDPSRGLLISAPITASCTGGGTPGTFTAISSDRGFTQTPSSTIIAANSSCTITVPILAQTLVDNTPVSYTNTIPQGAVDVGNAAIVSQARSASILVADTIRVLKTADTTNPRPGNPVRYSLTVQNWSAAALSNVRVQDSLPGSMTFLTGTINGNDFTPILSGAGCSGLSVASSVGDSTAEFTIGTVPARPSASTPGACVVRFYAMVDPNATGGTSTSNSITPGSVCTDNGAGFCNGGSSGSNNRPVVSSVVDIDKSFTPGGPLPEGTTSRMVITLSNASANPLSSLSISDTLPISGSVQMQIASPANAVTTCGAGSITATPGSTSVTLNGGEIPARENLGAGALGSCQLEVDVVGAAGIYNNTVTASGIETLADNTTRNIDPVVANASLTYTSILSASKSFSPDRIASGGKSTVTIRLSNSGPVALTNTTVNDPLPAGMTLDNPPNAYTSCAGSTSITAVAGASNISLSGASVAGGGECELVFDVVATGSADWINSIPPGGIEVLGTGIINQSAVAATLQFSPGTALTVAKATNPSTLTFPGESSRLTITVNSGNQPITNLSFTDYFTLDGTDGAAPNGMILTADPAPSTTCPGGVVTAAAATRLVSISGISLAAASSCTVSINVTAISLGGITNFIPPAALTSDQGLTNAEQATTSLTTQANLGLTKAFTPIVIRPDERSRLRLTLFNATAGVAIDLALIDTLPAGVVVAPGPNPSTSCSGATITVPAPDQVQVSGGILPPASGNQPSSCYVEIDVTASAEGSYENLVPTGDLTGSIGGVSVSNSRPATATLRVLEPLEIHKAIGGFTLDSGNPGGFTTGTTDRIPGATAPLVIRLSNPNATALTSTTLTDSLPSGVVLANPVGASTSCAGGLVNASPSGITVTLTGATIPASGSCTVTVNVLSNIPGTYLNEIAAGSVSTAEGVSNEEGTQAEIAITVPPSIAKQFSPAVIPPAGISRLTLVFGNSNDADITLSSAFTDTLPSVPGPVLVAATPNVTSSCVGAVTANSGASFVRLANGATIPAGGCEIGVDVTATTSGSHNNNIPTGDLDTSAGVNQDPANAALMVSTDGFISGRVFQDNNVTPDGIYANGVDTPLAGVAITLHSGPSCAGAQVDSTTTDAQGNYLFHTLSAGTYSVCQAVQPPDTSNSSTTAGSIESVAGSSGSAGTASNPSATSSQIVGVVLNNDGAGGETSGSPGNDFSEITLSSISGQVFLDNNNNGLLNGPDAGIPGQLIELLDGANNVIATTTTDSSGLYSFTGLQPGTYSVRQPAQATGTSNGITTPGSVGNGGSTGTATAVATTPSQISTIVLPPNTDSPANNFAEIPNGRTISGTVFLDYDNSGLPDGQDYGIGGQIIELTGTDINGNPVPPQQTTTNPDGSFSFTGLPEGTYTITQPNQPTSTSNGTTTAGSAGGAATNPATTPSVISTINLTGATQISAENLFAELPDSAPDLTVRKDHAPASFGAGSSTGYFTITQSNIGAVDTSGTITVVDTLPAGLTLAGNATGSDWTCSGTIGGSLVSCTSSQVIAAGGSGSPITVPVAVDTVAPTPTLTNMVDISGGGEPATFTGNNHDDDTVAVDGTARISGTVWADPNLDSILDSGENRLSNWQVELLLNGIVVATTRTDGNGQYSLDNLSPGAGYQLQFRDPVDGDIFGPPVTNEQGIAPNAGVRDDDAGAVTTNTGNPAGAVVGANALTNLVLFAGDDIIEQSLPVDPSMIPAPKPVPVLPVWALLLLCGLLLLVVNREKSTPKNSVFLFSAK